MLKIFIVIGMFLFNCCFRMAFAETSNLDGYWIFDTQSTEEAAMKTTFTKKDYIEEFVIIAGFSRFNFYEFEGDSLKLGILSLNGQNANSLFQLTSVTGKSRLYSSKDSLPSAAKKMNVYIINGNSIRIKYEHSQIDIYLKRGEKIPINYTQKEFQNLITSWTADLEKMKKLLYEKLNQSKQVNEQTKAPCNLNEDLKEIKYQLIIVGRKAESDFNKNPELVSNYNLSKDLFHKYENTKVQSITCDETKCLKIQIKELNKSIEASRANLSKTRMNEKSN